MEPTNRRSGRKRKATRRAREMEVEDEESE